MNRQPVLTFSVEMLISIVLLFFCTYFWRISYALYGFLLLVFLVGWFCCYRRSVVLLEYYTHVLTVSLYFLAVSCVLAFVLKDEQVFKLGLFTGCFWLISVAILRFFIINRVEKPYKIAIHPGLMSFVAASKKVDLVVSERVFPGIIKCVQAIIIEPGFVYNDTWENLINQAGQYNIPVLTVGEYRELVEQRLPSSHFSENRIYTNFNVSQWYLWVRNLLEFFVVLIMLPVLLCLFLIVASIILITMGGPVFYAQERIGRNGKTFKMYKFRSMMVSSEKNVAQFTVEGDKRITPFGVFMRRYRIDELPQFINILKGDMSLIGPRPEQQAFVKGFAENIPLYTLRHLVRPGITGWAQVMSGYAGNEDETKTKLQYDLYYVKHFSFIMDLKILLKTIQTVIIGFKVR
ncbi:MAG: sugar transferase [Gammaproteobacteria bacterium]|nr:sugar transferase [Gammaproteobacteria bacterium]